MSDYYYCLYNTNGCRKRHDSGYGATSRKEGINAECYRFNPILLFYHELNSTMYQVKVEGNTPINIPGYAPISPAPATVTPATAPSGNAF